MVAAIWKGRGAGSRGEEGGRRIGSGIGRGVPVDGWIDGCGILPEGKEGGAEHGDLDLRGEGRVAARGGEVGGKRSGDMHLCMSPCALRSEFKFKHYEKI